MTLPTDSWDGLGLISMDIIGWELARVPVYQGLLTTHQSPARAGIEVLIGETPSRRTAFPCLMRRYLDGPGESRHDSFSLSFGDLILSPVALGRNPFPMYNMLVARNNRHKPWARQLSSIKSSPCSTRINADVEIVPLKSRGESSEQCHADDIKPQCQV